MKSNFVFLLILALLSFISVEGCEFSNAAFTMIAKCKSLFKKTECKYNGSKYCECKCLD